MTAEGIEIAVLTIYCPIELANDATADIKVEEICVRPADISSCRFGKCSLKLFKEVTNDDIGLEMSFISLGRLDTSEDS